MRPPRSSRLRARLAALPAIALLALAGAFVIREGLAELLAIRANERIAAWEAGAPMSPAQFDAAEQPLRGAIRLSPANGDHRESLGTAWFARAMAPRRTLEGRLADFDRAVDAYREATRRSTVSGYAWGNLMLAKHYAGQIDPEFSQALHNAARYAPHEAPVQAMIVGAVLPRWVQLDGAARRLAAETVARGWGTHRAVLIVEAREAANRALWCDPALWPREESAAAAMRGLCAVLDEPPRTEPAGPARAP